MQPCVQDRRTVVAGKGVAVCGVRFKSSRDVQAGSSLSASSHPVHLHSIHLPCSCSCHVCLGSAGAHVCYVFAHGYARLQPTTHKTHTMLHETSQLLLPTAPCRSVLVLLRATGNVKMFQSVQKETAIWEEGYVWQMAYYMACCCLETK